MTLHQICITTFQLRGSLYFSKGSHLMSTFSLFHGKLSYGLILAASLVGTFTLQFTIPWLRMIYRSPDYSLVKILEQYSLNMRQPCRFARQQKTCATKL